MNTPLKLKDSDMDEIRKLQNDIHQLIIKLGTIQAEKIELETNEKNTKIEWENIKKAEKELLNKILTSYGEGNLSLTDGTFTPSPKS